MRDWAAPDGVKRVELSEGAMGACLPFVNSALLSFGETVYEPGCGTGGFLAQAFEWMRAGLGPGATAETPGSTSTVGRRGRVPPGPRPTKPEFVRFWSEFEDSFDEPFRSYVAAEFARRPAAA